MEPRRNILDKLTDNHVVTPDGRDWIKLALDPFHDQNHTVAGYPDSDASQTLVGCYQYQLEIARPAGTAANWDAHIFTLPQATALNDYVYTMAGNWKKMTELATSNIYPQSLLNISTGPAGANLSQVAGVAVAGVETQVLPEIGNYDIASGVTRIIGLGFEITNTTAEMYKQGSLTAYRMPQLGTLTCIPTASTSGSYAAAASNTMYKLPPSTVAQANLLKGTRTWDAAAGAYVTCLQNSIHNPLTQLGSNQIIYAATSQPQVADFNVIAQSGVAGAAGSSATGYGPTKQVPYDTSGVFLTGLSNSTTLTVKLRVYVERAPTWFDPSLAVQATPSAGYDIHALELYSQACNVLPPAVKVGENAKGDWWRAVLSVLRAAAVPIGLAVSPYFPAAAAIGASVSSVAEAIDTSVGKSVSNQVAKQANKVVKKPMSSLAKKKKIKLPVRK